MRKTEKSLEVGLKGVRIVEEILLDGNHLFQEIDGQKDKSIDGYIRFRTRVLNKKSDKYIYVDNGNIAGVQVKTISEIPKNKSSNSYYYKLTDSDKFGVNFGRKEKLSKHKMIWKSFIAPVILIFVDLETKCCWWCDAQNENSYHSNGYLMVIEKKNTFNINCFNDIKKLGREIFVSKAIPEIKTRNTFPIIKLSDFKNSAKQLYDTLALKEYTDLTFPETVHPTLGKIEFSQSGWKHITRLNRRKMRIFNSILLLPIVHQICTEVEKFTKVKRGTIRQSKRYIKKADYLTLRANVLFNFRQSSIVQVVLRRVQTFDILNPSHQVDDKVYFHSVYEPYRNE